MQVNVVLAILTILQTITFSVPGDSQQSIVWYSQIGQWKITHKDSTNKESYLYHDASKDGASSGEATANVRLNFEFSDIKRFEARIVLGKSPTKAGLLIQNKKLTYLFLIKKGIVFDSLQISRDSNRTRTIIAAKRIMKEDTSNLLLYIQADTLYIGILSDKIAIVKPLDFSKLTIVGFECLKGNAKILGTHIEARNKVVTDSFDKALLVNLHLDRIFK